MRRFLKSLLPVTQTARQRHRRKFVNSRAAVVQRMNATECLESRTLLSAQTIASDATTRTVSAGETIDVPVIYQTLNDSNNAAALQANLLSFNLHFDSNALTYVESTNLFTEGIQVVPNAVRLENDAAVTGDDSDPSTDSVLVASYSDSDFALLLGWPNQAVVAGQTLYVARFTVNAGFTGSTINFSENATGNVIGAASQFTFQSTSVDLQATTVASPTLNSLPNIADSSRPTVSWSTVPGAAGYEVWFARITPGPSRLYAESSAVSGTNWTTPEDLPAGTYRSWVRTNNGSGQTGPWSGSETFDVQPTLVDVRASTFGKRPTFRWSEIPNTTGYELYIRTTDSSFGTDGNLIVSDIPGDTTSWTPAVDLPGETVRWWVRDASSIFNRGWSAAGIISMVGRSAIDVASGDSVSWQDVTGAGRFILVIVDNDSNEVIRERNLSGSLYSFESALASGSYRAWIKAIDASTNLFTSGRWSRGFDFDVA